MGECLYAVGSKPVETRDSLGRQRFIVVHLEEAMRGGYPQWYIDRDEEGATMVRINSYKYVYLLAKRSTIALHLACVVCFKL